MLPYKTLINPDRAAKLPLYVQICNSFINLIDERKLQPGDTLPSTRKLADLIHVNRNTANLAYEELISQGWAESVNRKGIFVPASLPSVSKRISTTFQKTPDFKTSFTWINKFESEVAPLRSQKPALIIDEGFPDVRLAPIDHLMAEYRSISKRFSGKNFLKYGNPKGGENLRNSIGKYLLNTRGLVASADDILITKGSQMGIYLAAQLLIEPGDFVAVGNSNHLLADATFKLCGANLLRIPVDQNGIDTDCLEYELQTKKIKAVYVIPQHHCPTTVTLSVERRFKLLELAKMHSFAIIEDDFDFEFQYEDNAYIPLASMDNHENVVYIGSFSKTFAPSLRIGFLSGPPEFVAAAATLRKYMDRQGDTLLEESFASLLDNGEIDRHFRKAIKIYKERRNVFCDMLAITFDGIIEIKKPEGGLAIWTRFDKSIDLMKMSNHAAANGLQICNGNSYRNDHSKVNGLRMGFASLEIPEMEKAFVTLKKALAATGPVPNLALVHNYTKVSA